MNTLNAHPRDDAAEQYPRRYLPCVHSTSSVDLASEEAQTAIHSALDQYWDGPEGTLRLLNLKRGGFRDLRVPMGERRSVTIALHDDDAAPMPGSFAQLAGRALRQLMQLDSDVLAGSVSWLGLEARTIAPSTVGRRPKRIRPHCEGFAFVWSRIAAEALVRALRWPADWGRLYAIGGIALASELASGSDTLRRAAADEAMPERLRNLAACEPLDRAVRQAAKVVAGGRTGSQSFDVFEIIEADLETIGRGEQDRPQETVSGTRPHRGHTDQLATWHREDFTSVQWYGEAHAFNPSQAKCVGVLWQAYERGAPELRGKSIGPEVELGEDDFRLSKVFRSGRCPHPAWGTMIQQTRRGYYQLARPNPE